MGLEIKGYIVPDEDKEIYDYFGITSISPADVKTAITEADGNPLDVEISTCYGGDVFSGSEMYSQLNAYSGGVNITITGLAASAASVIAMAGKSKMSPTAQIMVHNVSSMAEGNYHDMDKASVRLQTANKSIAAAYVAKSGMLEADALEMMDKETWLTAAQAKEKGLIDEIMFVDTGNLVAACDGMLPRSVIEKTRNILRDNKPDNIPDSNTNEIETLKAKLALQLTL